MADRSHYGRRLESGGTPLDRVFHCFLAMALGIGSQSASIREREMSARLTTAIKIGDTALAVLRKTQSFPDREFFGDEGRRDLKDIGVEPMLLALSMELALKAWFVFDYDDPKIPKSHDLAKLFDKLKSESQEKLDSEFKNSVAPCHPSGLYIDYGIRHVLYQHKDAFTDWRYIHEPKSTMFERGVFEGTLEMVLKEFEKRYRVEWFEPLRSS